MALSGGERRRCEIARALAADPSIMLLDEPFAGIDPISIADIRELVRELKSRDIGVLITDHNVRETLDIVDRACIIYDGQVLSRVLPKRWSPTRRSGASTSARASRCSELRQWAGPLLRHPPVAAAGAHAPADAGDQAAPAVSNLELEAFIAEELSKNPLLEARSDEEGERPAGDSADDAGRRRSTRRSRRRRPDLGAAEDDRPLDVDWTAEALETDSFTDVVDVRRRRGSIRFRPGRICRRRRSPSICSTSCTVIPGAEGELARIIAETLEETGYLTVPLERSPSSRARRCRWSSRRWRIVQDLEPPGVGARSLAECLALQAKAADRYDPAMARLIDNLELLSKGRTADLKRICGVDDEDLADMIRELRAYDPKPGCQFSSQRAKT